MKVTEESEKVGLKLSIQKTKIMVSGPITSWEIDGETVETVSDFILEKEKKEGLGMSNRHRERKWETDSREKQIIRWEDKVK